MSAAAVSVVVVCAPLMDDSTLRLTRVDSTRNHQNNKMCMRLAIFIFLLFENSVTLLKRSFHSNFQLDPFTINDKVSQVQKLR